MVWEALFPKLRFRSDKINRLLTGVYVTFTFSVFRSDSLSQAWLLCKRLFTGGYTGFLPGMANTLQIPEIYVIRKGLEQMAPSLLNPFYIGCMVFLLVVSLVIVASPKAEVWIERKGRKIPGLLFLATIFTWSFISLSQVSTFLYFDF